MRQRHYGTCDADPGETAVTVALKIDDDSGKGIVFVKQTDVPDWEQRRSETADTIDITVAQVPTTLTC